MRDDTFVDLGGSRFWWDNAKAVAVLRKHGLSFADVVTAFFDRSHVTYPDPKFPERGHILGTMVYGPKLTKKLVLAVYVEVIEDREYRLITARAPTPSEKHHYLTGSTYHPDASRFSAPERRTRRSGGTKKRENREEKLNRRSRDPAHRTRLTLLAALQQDGIAGRGIPWATIPTKARVDSPLKAMQERAWRIQRASHLPTVGARVREMRLAVSMTQQQLANKTRISVTDISKIERNKLAIGMNRAGQLARIFGVSPAAILYATRICGV